MRTIHCNLHVVYKIKAYGDIGLHSGKFIIFA